MDFLVEQATALAVVTAEGMAGTGTRVVGVKKMKRIGFEWARVTMGSRGYTLKEVVTRIDQRAGLAAEGAGSQECSSTRN